MDMGDEEGELGQEVLSYSAFLNRQLLEDWRERRRVYQAREDPGRSDDRPRARPRAVTPGAARRWRSLLKFHFNAHT